MAETLVRDVADLVNRFKRPRQKLSPVADAEVRKLFATLQRVIKPR